MDRLQRNYDHALKIAFIFLLGSLVYYRKLGTYRLQSWDEAWYAIQGKYALVHGQWVATQTFLQGSSTIGPQFKMPPLHAWLQALSFSVFGFTEFAARLPSATATILLACVIYWIGTREFSSRVGWIGAICWLILPALWGVSGGRQAIEDVIFSLVGVLYVYAAYRVVSDDDPRWLTLAGVFAGLSLLTKGLNAGIFVIVLLPLVIWRWRFFINTVHTTACVALTAILGASWPLYMYSEFGDRFIQVFIVSQVLNRATGGARGDPTFAL